VEIVDLTEERLVELIDIETFVFGPRSFVCVKSELAEEVRW